ncbi:MAG: hypothetical protein J6L87_06865 [Clostridia bacterium]|nr:hypothetical protein [Clostridia bacterium]
MGNMEFFASRYLLESTGDHTDRTAEIEEMLRTHGACVLGAGEFTVSGVKMPDHTTLMGLGTATRLYLDPALEEGFAVQIGSFCTVKDMALYGAYEDIPTPTAVGSRHGLYFMGTATTKNWKNSGPRNSIVSGCLARYFSGGGLTCVDTGYLIYTSLTVTNCHMLNCGAGINISHFSEYHEFTNVLSDNNLYGCINNGGNNVFTNCGFNDNETGFLMDNSENQSPNNSHGSAVGCTFNHNGNNEGIAIQVLGCQHGYVFTGCQLFFGKIVVENSVGILFNSFNVGRDLDVSITGGKLTMFTDCVFHSAPASLRVEDNALVKFINCYTRDGECVGV